MENFMEIIIVIMAGATGFMNIFYGFKKYTMPATRVQGMTSVIIGMLIWVVGIYFLQTL